MVFGKKKFNFNKYVIMKKIIILCLLMTCFGYVANANNGSSQGASKENTKTFKKYGFSITAPCVLEDKTVLGMGNDAYYVGTVGNPGNATSYQVVVKKIPKSINDCTEAEQNEMMDQIKSSGFTNVEKVLFSDHKYPGFIGDKHEDADTVRAVMFNKDKYMIVFTVITNSDLDKKFKEFTSSFKVIN